MRPHRPGRSPVSAHDAPLLRRVVERVAQAVATSITRSAQTGDRWPPQSRYSGYRRQPLRVASGSESNPLALPAS